MAIVDCEELGWSANCKRIWLSKNVKNKHNDDAPYIYFLGSKFDRLGRNLMLVVGLFLRSLR